MGGLQYIYLTHIDDVVDHAKFASRFGAKRIIHKLEAIPRRSAQIDQCEILLEGSGPWEPVPEVDGITIYFQVRRQTLKGKSRACVVAQDGFLSMYICGCIHF